MLGIALLLGAAASLALGVGRLATKGAAPPQTAPAPPPAADGERAPAPPTRARADAPPPVAFSAPTTIADANEPSAPPTIPGAAPLPSAAAAEGPTEQPAEPEDAPGLLSFQGHLTVQSSVDAEVVVQGQPAGRTNQRLLTRCGPRNVRLRDGKTWITEGEHVRIVCMKHTSIRLEPPGGRR